MNTIQIIIFMLSAGIITTQFVREAAKINPSPKKLLTSFMEAGAMLGIVAIL